MVFEGKMFHISDTMSSVKHSGNLENFKEVHGSLDG